MQEHGDSIHQRFSAKKGGIEKKKKRRKEKVRRASILANTITLFVHLATFFKVNSSSLLYILYIYNKNL